MRRIVLAFGSTGYPHAVKGARISLLKKSNQNPIEAEDLFSFGAFEFSPAQRRLTKKGRVVRLKPKVLDLLLLLVSRAGQLVSRNEIRRTLWPDVQVEDSNLTNSIAAIRRVLGRKAIQTSPKNGYCFDLPLTRRPGLSAEVTALFDQAKALFPRRSVDAITKARNLFLICLAQSPGSAEAWAWLGRCSRFLGKHGHDGPESSVLAEYAFRRALLIEPDLSFAHEFYSFLQVDQGQATQAMVRLLEQGRKYPEDPRILAALTHVLRYCGLLDASLAAHERAITLRADLQTSVAHTLFNCCDYAGVIEAYGGPTQTNQRGYLDLAAWAALNHDERAANLARKRLEGGSLPPGIRSLVLSLLNTLEGKMDKVEEQSHCIFEFDDPEGALYHARHLCRCGHVKRSIELLRSEVIDRSYGCAHVITNDPWFAKLSSHTEFCDLLNAATQNEERSRAEFRRAGGERLLQRNDSNVGPNDLREKRL